ncbi:DsbA family protein [Vibrio sp. MA40-2]|uniref:DsbA family protein n=1 Tax=Vibrio sp. MA40-2 TaxID=3391828 RepID=UPI0039A51370
MISGRVYFVKYITGFYLRAFFIQATFYSENYGISDDGVLIYLAKKFGLNKDRFVMLYNSEEIKQQTRMDFSFAKQLQVTAFPTIIVKDLAGYAYLTVGYQPYEDLKKLVEAWLTDELPEKTSGSSPEPINSCFFE